MLHLCWQTPFWREATSKCGLKRWLVDNNCIESGNQTWQWKVPHLWRCAPWNLHSQGSSPRLTFRTLRFPVGPRVFFPFDPHATDSLDSEAPVAQHSDLAHPSQVHPGDNLPMGLEEAAFFFSPGVSGGQKLREIYFFGEYKINNIQDIPSDFSHGFWTLVPNDSWGIPLLGGQIWPLSGNYLRCAKYWCETQVHDAASQIVVSWNRGIPKSSILMGFSP